MARQRTQIDAFRARLQALPRTGWTTADEVDATVLRVELNQQEFEHRVLRPASRNPNFYVQQVTMGLPANPARVTAEQAGNLAARLTAAAALLDRARGWLTEASQDHALIALRYIERPAGVRNQLSAVERLQTLARETATAHPALSRAAGDTATALAGYGQWIRANLAKMTAPGHIGLDEFNWYLRHVFVMPYTAQDLLVLAERDYQRTMANLAFHENRNRTLPKQLPAATPEAYDTLVKDADALVRRWLVEGNIISIPDDVGPMGATVPWQEGGRTGQKTPRHYWQEIQFRDPLPDHVHAGIPGHRSDGIVSRRNPRPIRAGFSSQGRTEGWGFYLEEMAHQSGLLKDRPRTEELFDNFQLFRYLRMTIDIKMSAGEMRVADATAYQIEVHVPFMEEQVASIDASGYFLRPTAGSSYTAGKYQMEALIARLRHELGDRFDLRTVHDRFMAAGAIPIALIEWELTGDRGPVTRILDSK